MWYIEVIGILATIFILISMSINTSSLKGDVIMRAINIAGSVVFVVYGALLPAISTAVLNGLLVFVNIYHLVKLIKLRKKEEQEKQSVAQDEPSTDAEKVKAKEE